VFQYFNRKHIFLAFQCKLCLHFPTPATLFPPPHTTGDSACKSDQVNLFAPATYPAAAASPDLFWQHTLLQQRRRISSGDIPCCSSVAKSFSETTQSLEPLRAARGGAQAIGWFMREIWRRCCKRVCRRKRSGDVAARGYVARRDLATLLL